MVIGRPRVAIAYALLSGLMAAAVIAQGLLFAGFYSELKADYLNAHEQLGVASELFTLVILTPLGFLARFPRKWRVGWQTLALAVVWNIQAHVFGYGIEDERTLEMVHIPVAFLIFGFALYLTGKTLGESLRSLKPDVTPIEGEVETQ